MILQFMFLLSIYFVPECTILMTKTIDHDGNKISIIHVCFMPRSEEFNTMVCCFIFFYDTRLLLEIALWFKQFKST